MLAALISAIVAFAVLTTSQWIIYRRERSNMLAGKLEELYLLLVDLSRRNGRRFASFLPPVVNDPSAPTPKLSFDELLAFDLTEKIELLVEFYFPALRRDKEALNESNHQCIRLILLLQPPPPAEVEAVAGRLPDLASRLRRRIVLERRVLSKILFAEGAESYDRATYG